MAKNKKKISKEDVIPLPVQVTGSHGWYHTYLVWKNWMFPSCHRITGNYLAFSKSIWIQKQDHLLYQQGYFGKGSLSRSEPTWHTRLQRAQSQEMAPEQITEARRKQRKQGKKQKSKVSSSSPRSPMGEEERRDNNERWTLEQLAEETQMEDYEHFILDVFEAFFLVYGLDVLDILDKEQRRLGIEDCWSLFSEAYSPSPSLPTPSLATINTFAVNYTAYHYYRSQGWVPKDGLKFGTTFVLYHTGPAYHHAEFAVLVIPCISSPSSSSSLQSAPSQPTLSNWTQLLRLNRVCNQVKKSLVLCYVNIPSSTDTWDLSVLRQCNIREVILKRWSPESNRD